MWHEFICFHIVEVRLAHMSEDDQFGVIQARGDKLDCLLNSDMAKA